MQFTRSDPSRAFLIVILSILCLASLSRDASARTNLRAYWVGNSLSWQVAPELLAPTISGARSDSLTYGYNVRTGSTLKQIWDDPTHEYAVQPYGFYPTALSSYQWDAISLQPFSQTIEGSSGDRAYVSNFINYARQKSPNAQFYLYSQWPTVGNDGQLNFDQKWLGQYDGQLDDSVRTRDYYQDLLGVVRSDFAGASKPVLLVPAGDVMYELNQRMHAGQVPGYTDIQQFYSDGIHLKPVGSYMLGMTFYATMFKTDPHGLGGWDQYGITDAAVATAIQDAAWDVVRANPFTGVPEPSAGLFVLTGLALPALRRRR